DDLLRQPRHAAHGRQRRGLHRRPQLAVHRARDPGRLLRLGSRLRAWPRRARRQPQLLRPGTHRRGAGAPDLPGTGAGRPAARRHPGLAAGPAAQPGAAGRSRRVLPGAAGRKRRTDRAGAAQQGRRAGAVRGGTLSAARVVARGPRREHHRGGRRREAASHRSRAWGGGVRPGRAGAGPGTGGGAATADGRSAALRVSGRAAPARVRVVAAAPAQADGSLDCRTRSVAGSITLPAGSPRTWRMTVSTSMAPALAVSWATVVSGGWLKRAAGMSSKPATATSSGTRS